jgi:hypothetical protein
VLICCAYQKGGVGKTATAVNLAVCLPRQTAGRVLAVDCDPQATMTRRLGIDVRTTALTLVDVLAGRVGVADAVVPDVVAGVDVIAGARDLAGVEMALVGEIGREGAAVLAAWSIDLEGEQPGALARASRQLARSAELPAYTPVPRRPLPRASGPALFMLAAGRPDRAVGWLLVRRELGLLAGEIGRVHRVRGELHRASEIETLGQDYSA